MERECLRLRVRGAIAGRSRVSARLPLRHLGLLVPLIAFADDSSPGSRVSVEMFYQGIRGDVEDPRAKAVMLREHPPVES